PRSTPTIRRRAGAPAPWTMTSEPTGWSAARGSGTRGAYSSGSDRAAPGTGRGGGGEALRGQGGVLVRFGQGGARDEGQVADHRLGGRIDPDHGHRRAGRIRARRPRCEVDPSLDRRRRGLDPIDVADRGERRCRQPIRPEGG